MKSLSTKALLSLVALSVTMGLLLFVPAGTRKYWQAWVYLGIFTGASLLTTLYLTKKGLIPRGSTFLSAALHVPSPEVAKRNFQLAADDYEKVLRLQTPFFSKLPVHSGGELLGGLAEAWNGLGDTQKWRGYLQRMMEEFPDTSYSRRAKDVLSTSPRRGALGTTCLGCHVGAAT